MIDEIQMGEADGGDRITGCVSGKVERGGVCECRRAFSHDSARGRTSRSVPQELTQRRV